MSVHVCKQCGLRFEYCRMCVFRPVRYKDKGFCSKECYEASKNVVEPVVELEPVVEEVVTVEPIVEDVQPIVEEIITEPSAEVEVFVEASIVAEPTIKNETNTYKNKKNKYEVHE